LASFEDIFLEGVGGGGDELLTFSMGSMNESFFLFVVFLTSLFNPAVGVDFLNIFVNNG
jgi:hypothetical protein